MRSDSVKLLEENKGETFHGISLGNELFVYEPKNIGRKSKNRQLGLQQSKKFLYRKETINRVKQHLPE